MVVVIFPSGKIALGKYSLDFVPLKKVFEKEMHLPYHKLFTNNVNFEKSGFVLISSKEVLIRYAESILKQNSIFESSSYNIPFTK